MPAGPVGWSTFTGETLEHGMGIFLVRENPKAKLRTPSSGDGGVDVYEPHEDGYRVYQVKGFHGRLGSSRRRQIREALAATAKDPRLDKPVTEWLLVVPTKLTSAEETWLKKEIEKSQLNGDWRDIAYWDSMAAKYPDVTDYYFGNGKERLRQAMRDVGQLLSDPDEVIRADEVDERLISLVDAVNRSSPHYKYYFRFTRKVPPPPDDLELFVQSKTRGTSSGDFFTWDIYARFEGVEEVEPLTGRIQILLRDDEERFDITEAFAAFDDFGRALDLPLGAVKSMEMTQPGGFVETLKMAGGRFGPKLLEPFKPVTTKLELLKDGVVVADCLVNLATATAGRAGMEFKGSAAEGAFNVQISLPYAGDAQFHVDAEPFAGKQATHILQGVRFLANFEVADEFIWRAEFGPDLFGRAPLAAASPFIDPLLVMLIESMAEIQKMVSLPLVVPDAGMSVESVLALREVAGILRGDTIQGHWSEATLETDDVGPFLGPEFDPSGPLVLSQSLEARLPNGTHKVGSAHTVLKDAAVANREELLAGKTKEVRLVPASSDEWYAGLGDTPSTSDAGVGTAAGVHIHR